MFLFLFFFFFLANEKPPIKLCNCLSPLRTILVRTQNMATGLNLYSGSQSICMVGFGFPTMCGPSPGDPVTHSYLQHPFSLSLSHKTTSLSFGTIPLLSPCLLLRVSNPPSSHLRFLFIA